MTILYFFAYYHKNSKEPSPRLLKDIDRINNILYHMILIVYMIIAVCAIIAFRPYIWEAVSAGKHKMAAIFRDMHKAVGLGTNHISAETAHTAASAQGYSTIDYIKSIATTEKARNLVNSGAKLLKEAKESEMQKYTMGLVFWQQIFLIPLYIGLFSTKCNSELIKTFG
jgi:biopolymer transport protein ExbB/TolQ